MKKIGLLVFAMITVISCQLAQNQQSKPEDQIRLNQIGFYSHAPKVAIIEKDVSVSFHLVSERDSDTLFSGDLSGPQEHQYGPRTVRQADFSAVTTPGLYTLYVDDLGRSHPFRIGADVHKQVAEASIKSYYFQRASTALAAQFAGKWERAAGHPDDSVLVHASAATEQRPAGTVISSPKGWYDAGDYNKYIVNSGISMGTMFSLMEDYTDYANSIELHIPESDNRLPDLLDELLWNLRWMLTMQDPHDGGVYHKMTSADFSGTVMPAEDTDGRYVVQKSVTATLDYAAVMAQAARMLEGYEQQLPGLADSCLSAAKQAWNWAQEHPRQFYNQDEMNKQYDIDITTGAYGDNSAQDEFIWAAAELYVTTGNQSYYNAVDIIPGEQMPLPSWANVQALGYYTLLRFEDQLTGAAQQDLPKIREMLLSFADKLVRGDKQSAYRTVMGHAPGNFMWGSNSVAGNQGIALIQAYRLTGDNNYIDYALSNLDYLMGRNGTSYAFVTGYGDKTPMHPHHRPSGSDDIVQPVPGLIVGGPNPGQQDGCNYPSDIPDQSYVDDYCSYASNEIAINWNAPLVYLSSAIEVLQYQVGYSE